MDQGFWKQLCDLYETRVEISLNARGQDEPAYEQNIDLTDLQYIGDNLSGMVSFNFSIAIFKIPQAGNPKPEYFVSYEDF